MGRRAETMKSHTAVRLRVNMSSDTNTQILPLLDVHSLLSFLRDCYGGRLWHFRAELSQ